MEHINKKSLKIKLLIGTFLGVMLAGIPQGASAAPVLLANYRFDGNAFDDTGNSPPMQLFNTSFVSNTLFMPVIATNWQQAEVRITGFSYNSFTVALDFKPMSAAALYPEAILYGGVLYRWMGFERVNDHLRLTLNNHNLQYDFPDTSLQTNNWHTLVCSVDLAAQTVITFLDGVPLPDIHLQNFQFNVIGTDYEEWGKEFDFTDHSTASAFRGFADNLKVFDRALTAAEINSLLVPRVNCVPRQTAR